MTGADDRIFVGRGEELQNLIGFARDALSGKASVAFVTGEPGIGKISLVEEVFRQLREDYKDLVVATARCKRGSTSYFPFRSVMEDLLAPSGMDAKITGDIAVEKRDTIRAVVIDIVQEVGLAVGEIFFPSVAANVAEKTLEQQKDRSGIIVTRDLGQVQIFGWYTQIMKALSQRFPLALFLDDLHLADISSLNLLLHLGREIKQDQLLMVGTYHSRKAISDSLLKHIKNILEHLLPVGVHHPHEITSDFFLGQLKIELEHYGAKELSLDVPKEGAKNREKMTQFVHEYLIAKYGTTFSDQFEEFFVEISDGNPLFLTEALIDFEERGRIKRKTSEKRTKSNRGNAKDWKLPSEFEFIKNFPEKVEEVISRRVNRLEDRFREILEYASVQGDEFIMEAIPNINQAQSDELTQTLKDHRFILDKGEQLLPNGNRIHKYVFRHPLIREYIYTQLSTERRSHFHAKTGKDLELVYKPNTDEIVPELANHFYHGHISDKAVLYCLRAAEEANRQHGKPEAERFGLMGLKALEEEVSIFSEKAYAEYRWRLLLELANAEEAGGDRHPEKDHLQIGIAYLEDNLPLLHVAKDELHAEVYVQLGKLYVRQGLNKQAAQENFERALYIYEQCDDRKNIVEVLYQLARILPTDKSIKTLEKSCSIAEQLQAMELRIRCLSLLTKKYADKNFPQAEKCAQQALQLSTQLEKPNGYLKLKALNVMASICRQNGKFQTGIRYLEESLEIARRIGDLLLEAAILNDLGFDYGRFSTLQEKAQDTLEQSISIRERAGLDKSAPLYNLGWLFTRQGKWKEAEDCFQKAIIASDEATQAVYRGNIGHLFELRENYAQAEMELLYRLEVLEKYESSQNVFGYTGIALNYALAGNEVQSRHYLEIAYTLFDQETRPRRKWWCLYEIADGYRMLKEYDTAKTACRKSIEWFLNNAENAENLVYLAGARLVLGKTLVDMGAYQDALPYLDKAKATFEICHHYALGETLLYLGKAHQGLGDRQARNYVNQALTEFHRLELPHKAHEAQEMLDTM